jgi:hypothetical protein
MEEKYSWEGIRLGGSATCGHYLLPTVLPVLVPLVTVTLGQCWVITTIPTAEVDGSFGLAVEVGLDRLLTGGILGGDVQEFLCHAWVSWPSTWTSAS